MTQPIKNPPMPTGSSLERASKCPGSFHLPQVQRTTEAAVRGTENHSEAEAAVDAGDWGKLPPIAKALMDEQALLGHKARSEVTYAIDPVARTVRELGAKLGRNYGEKKPGEIVLTLDLVMGPLVLDWKSRTRVTSAKENFQIRAGILAVAVVGGFDALRGGLVYLADGWADMASFDSFDIEETWSDLESIVNRVNGWNGESYHEGEWCKYCPAFLSCQAKRNAVALLIQTEEMTPKDASPSDYALLWERVKRAKEVVERAEDVVKEAVRNLGDLPLSNAKRLTVVQESRTSLDSKKAEAALVAAGLPVPKRTSSFTSVKERNA